MSQFNDGFDFDDDGFEFEVDDGSTTSSDNLFSMDDLSDDDFFITKEEPKEVEKPRGIEKPTGVKKSRGIEQSRGVEQSKPKPRPVPSKLNVGNRQQRPVQGNQRPVHGNQRPVHGNQRPVHGNQRPVQGNQRPVQGQQVGIQQSQPNIQQTQMQQSNVDDLDSTMSGNTTKKKGGKGKFILIILVLVIGIAVYLYMTKGKQEEEQQPQQLKEQMGVSEQFLTSLQQLFSNSFDASRMDSFVGNENGDSYIAQEWAYANSNEVRERWLQTVIGSTKFSKASESGDIIVRHIDYNKIIEDVEVSKPDIENVYKIKGYKSSDYTYQDECIDLMLDYLTTLPDLPMCDDVIKLKEVGGKLESDKDLDMLLFSSDSWHNLCDTFDKIYTGFTGKKVEYYWGKKQVHNSEYDTWYKLFKKYYNKDKGHFHKGRSKWEPWYKRDSHNKVIKDAKGKKIVNYYSVKAKDGTDWIQPSKTKWVKVQKTREVDMEYIPEKAVTRCFIGAYYCQNLYNGTENANIRVGDGTIQHPAGIGTPIVTSVKGTDGIYHDVKVQMTGYWLGKNAIDYCVSFSEKNRGLDPESVLQIVAYEIEVENLEDRPFTFSSEMCLCDENSNKSSRTGTMYGFTTENISVEPHKKVLINDWASSTEINQKYAIWGNSFDRQYTTVYFKILAGKGDVPTYSAYKAFTEDSTKSGSSNVQRREDGTISGSDAEKQKELQQAVSGGSVNRVSDSSQTGDTQDVQQDIDVSEPIQ